MGSSQTTTQDSKPYGPAQPGIKHGLRDSTQLYNQGGFNVQPFGGSMVAGYDPFRQQADQSTQGAFQGSLGAAQQAQGTLGSMMDPNQRSGAWDQIRQNTIASIMPGINGSFAGSGMTGSSLHQQNLAAGLSQGLAGVENQNWQQGQDRAMQAAGMVPGINQAAYGATDYLRGAGQDRQGYQQDVLNSQILQDQQRQQAPIDAIQNYLALQSGAGSQFGVQSSTSRNNPGLFGLLGAGLQAAPLLMSDRRLKDDIKRIGQTDDGLPIYTYRYKGGGPVQMGVMADELEAVKPDAVHMVAGYRMVDYGAI